MPILKQLNKYASLLMLTASFLFVANSQAAEQSPDKVIDEASKRILTEIEPRKDELRDDPAKLYKIVEDIIIPHFDFDTISKRVLGKAWKDATPEQRTKFTATFKDLLVRTYSNALLEYSGEAIKWTPIDVPKDATKVIQEAQVSLASGQTVPMKWGLRKIANAWKVYDISIDGISLVTNYRSVFASEVRKNGLDALIQRLESKNTADNKS